MVQLQVPKLIQKHVPKPTKGVIPTTMVYIGVDTVFSFIDNIVGSPLQKIGANLPFVGRFSAKDVITYMAVAQGARFNTDTVIAFFANKLLGQGISSTNQIRGIVSPIVSQPAATSGGSGVAATVTQGAPL